MTALPSRRRKRSVFMLLGTLLTVAAVPVLGYVGARAILDSEGGTDALADNLPIVPFPATPTALLATTDGNGRLTSTTVMVLDPSGLGGSIISVPVNSTSASPTTPGCRCRVRTQKAGSSPPSRASSRCCASRSTSRPR